METCWFDAALRCRYLLHVPSDPGNSLVVLTLHGYGSNPEAMLRLTIPLVGAGHVVAAIQAPFQHYLGENRGGAETGYNWGVRNHHEDAIRLHHYMVRRVLEELRHRFAVEARRCLLVGFSQPVGLNYRFIGTYPEVAGGVVGLCGGVPRDWEEDKYRAVTTPLLHIAREEDEFFPVETSSKFPERLRTHAADVEFHMMPGGHRFPSKASAIVQPWLERVFGV
jgi:predicted esterase